MQLYTMLQIAIHVSQHYKPRPITAFRRIVGRIVAIFIGLLLLLFVYYSFRYDFLPKNGYNSRYIVIVAAFGLLLTVRPLWLWFKEWRRSWRRGGRK
jgi:hypothetical protein